MKKILNNFVQTFTYTPPGRKNPIQEVLLRDNSIVGLIFCFIVSSVLLLVGPYNYFVTNIVLYLIVVPNYAYAYIFSNPEIMKNINTETHLKRYALLYFSSVCLLAILASIFNRYGDNIVSVVLLTFIIGQQYLIYFKDDTRYLYTTILIVLTFLMLLFIFNDLISPFLFCITGVSIIFLMFNSSSYTNEKKEDLMKHEAAQFIYILLFFVNFVVQVRCIDIQSSSKRIRNFKKRFGKNKVVSSVSLLGSKVNVESEEVYVESDNSNMGHLNEHVKAENK